MRAPHHDGDPVTDERRRVRHGSYDAHSPRGSSSRGVGMPAAIDTNRCRRVTCGRISASTACITCGFTASTTISLGDEGWLSGARPTPCAREAGEQPRLGISLAHSSRA
jgi:hypothetical protein